MNPGNPYLQATLCQCALAAGGKRAVPAVAHAQLMAAYHVVGGADHKGPGADHFDRLAPGRLKRNLVARLEHLGFKVNLEEKPAA